MQPQLLSQILAALDNDHNSTMYDLLLATLRIGYNTVYTTGNFTYTTTVTCYTVPVWHTIFTGAAKSHGLYTNTIVCKHRGIPRYHLPRPWVWPEVSLHTIALAEYYKLSLEDKDSVQARFFPRHDAWTAPTSSGMSMRSFSPQSPRHKKARIIDAERRLCMKWSSCQPCEKRCSTAIDVAENLHQWKVSTKQSKSNLPGTLR
jgi:hypothetical protein